VAGSATDDDIVPVLQRQLDCLCVVTGGHDDIVSSSP